MILLKSLCLRVSAVKQFFEKMKKNFFALLLTITLLLPSAAFGQQAVRITPVERRIASSITAEQLSDYLHFVASDAMEGRDTPSRGLDMTAEFLKMMLSRWGFKPAGNNGTFFQKMSLRSDTAVAANNILQVGGKDYVFNTDFFRMSGNGSTNSLLVYAKNGWQVKSKGIDPYQGLDVKGKIVVLYDGGFPNPNTLTPMPAGVTQADLTGTKGTDWADPMTYARQNAAAGLILIASPQLQSRWQDVRAFLSRGNMYPEKLREGGNTQVTNFPVTLVSTEVGDAIFAGEAGNKDSATGFAINKNVAMTTMSKPGTQWTQNVVAVWEGGHPVLKTKWSLSALTMTTLA